MSGTWAITQIDSTYKHVLNVAQNRNSGQYMLAITTNGDSHANTWNGNNPDGNSWSYKCRVYKSDNFGSTWTLLDSTNVINLDYAAFESENSNHHAVPMGWCAISDDGKYQMFIQGPSGDKRIWYSNNYGSTTGTTTEKWQQTWQNGIFAWPSNGGNIGKYEQGGTEPHIVICDGTATRWRDGDLLNSSSGGQVINTRDVTNAKGFEFSMDVGSSYTNSVYHISDGKIFKVNDNNNNHSTSATVITPTTSNTTDGTSFPVDNSQGGNIVVDISNEVLFCARYQGGSGGIWRSGDTGSNWTKKTGDINVNAIAMSSNAQHVIAGPMQDTNGNATFYLSHDSGDNWTTHDISYSGFIFQLDITNDGKRAVASANQRPEHNSNRYFMKDGYFTFIAPMTAAEQYAAGKTVAELITMSYPNSEIINAGYSYTQLLDGGIPLQAILDENVTVQQLYDGGVTIQRLLDENVTVQQLLDANVTVQQLLDANVTFQALLDGGVTVQQLLDANVTFQALLDGGVTVQQLYDGGVTVQQLLDANVTVQQLLDANVTQDEINIALTNIKIHTAFTISDGTNSSVFATSDAVYTLTTFAVKLTNDLGNTITVGVDSTTTDTTPYYRSYLQFANAVTLTGIPKYIFNIPFSDFSVKTNGQVNFRNVNLDAPMTIATSYDTTSNTSTIPAGNYFINYFVSTIETDLVNFTLSYDETNNRIEFVGLAQDISMNITSTDTTIFDTSITEITQGANTLPFITYGQPDPTLTNYIDNGITASELLSNGYTIQQLLENSVIPDWNFVTDANHFDQSYVKGFTDVSGSVVIRNDNRLMINGDLSLGGNLTIHNYPPPYNVIRTPTNNLLTSQYLIDAGHIFNGSYGAIPTTDIDTTAKAGSLTTITVTSVDMFGDMGNMNVPSNARICKYVDGGGNEIVGDWIAGRFDGTNSRMAKIRFTLVGNTVSVKWIERGYVLNADYTDSDINLLSAWNTGTINTDYRHVITNLVFTTTYTETITYPPNGTTSLLNDDMTLKSRLFMGEDISANGKVNIGGDLSVNGQFSGDFANGIIPQSAIGGSGGGINISGNVYFADDVSFNGPTVDVTNTLQVNQIEFNDGTTVSTHDDNILSGTFAGSNVVFKDSTFVQVTCVGTATANSTTTSDYRIKENVTELNETDTVDALIPIQYNNTLSGNHEFGLLAHELQDIYPDLVNGEKDGDEYQQVHYNGLIGVLVKEIQDLKQRLAVLNNR